MSALPGQRSTQQPYRAATSAYRALGKAAQAGAGGVVGMVGIGFVDGQQWTVDLAAPPGEQAQLAELPCGCFGTCTADHELEDPGECGADTQERQG
ncbi:hypothetical protein ACFWXA_30900 [Streptomyces atroolivaceus]|uniref:hypothetical protein n=1 Tax=Streptomyces atroolivaceus TaxID=66869 RepID=UPI00364B18BD